MSRPVRVAFVVEGPTDYIVLRAAVRALLKGRDFEATFVWPELADNLRPTSAGGWGGVYRWCRQVVQQAGGPARINPVFSLNDIVIVQVDADVARKKYGDCEIKDTPADDLPCEKECPPVSDTTNALRAVMLGWLNETMVPPGAVLCTPSKNLETWVLVGLFPDNEQALKENLECRWGLDRQLRKYGLMKGNKKLIDQYQAREREIEGAWPDVRLKCSEAERFSVDLLGINPI